MEGRVLLRRVDVVRGAVVVHEEGLVAGHLAALEVAGHDVQAIRRVGQLSARELVLRGGRHLHLLLGADATGPRARVGPEAAPVDVGSRHPVRHRHPAPRALVAGALALEVEPHDELPGLPVVDHLGALDDAAHREVVVRVVLHHGQDDALVLPVVEVPRRVAVDAHLGRVAGLALDLVLPEPVVAALEVEDPAPVRVDVDAAVVGPQLAGPEGGVVAAGRDGDEPAATRARRRAERKGGPGARVVMIRRATLGDRQAVGQRRVPLAALLPRSPPTGRVRPRARRRPRSPARGTAGGAGPRRPRREGPPSVCPRTGTSPGGSHVRYH